MMTVAGNAGMSKYRIEVIENVLEKLICTLLLQI